MRNGGLPKQFLKIMGKPIVIYTIEKFEQSEEIDKIILVCHGSYIEYTQNLLNMYQTKKTDTIIVGGADRQNSICKGLEAIEVRGGQTDDIVLIHDGVRPLVSQTTISENIRIAKQYGSAVTVHPVTETMIITDSEEAMMSDFKKRADTFSMTAPQTFKFGDIKQAYSLMDESDEEDVPLLDAAMVYAKTGKDVHLVKELGTNIKITTPEDYYYLRAILELEENKYIFGL